MPRRALLLADNLLAHPGVVLPAMERVPAGGDVRVLTVTAAEPSWEDALPALGVFRVEADLSFRHVTLATPGVAHVLAEPPERFVREPGLWLSRVHPEERAALLARLESRADHVADVRMLDAKGNVVWVRQACSLVRESGVPRGWRAVCLDVTAAKAPPPPATPQDARMRTALLEAQLEAVPDGLLVVSDEGRMLSHNQRFLDMWGISEKAASEADHAATRETLMRLMPDPEAFVKRVDEINDAPAQATRDLLKLSDGRVFDRYSAPVRDADGRIYGRVWSFRDITDRKKGEETLARLLLEVEDQRRRLDNIVASVPGIVWEAWRAPDETRVDFVSEHVEKMLGFTRHEWLAVPDFWLTRVHAEERERVAAEYAALLASGAPGSLTFRCRRKDGGHVWAQASLVAVRDERGEPIGVRGVILDVSQLKAAEEAVRVSDERFRLITRATNDAIWDWDLGTNALWWNENFSSMFGYAPAEIEPGIESWTTRIHPQDLARVKTGILAAIERGDATWTDEYRFRCKDGSWAQIYDRGFIIRDANGAGVRMVGSMMDITARKRSEEALARLASIVQNTDDAIYAKSPDGKITEWNPGAERLYGYTRAEIVGKPIQTVVPPERVDEEQAILARVSRGESVPAFETVRVRRNGERFDVSLTVSPVRDGSGRIVGASAIARDVSDRKRAHALLAWQRHVLERIAAGAPLSETLDVLCRKAEEQAAGRSFSVLLVDEDGRRLRHGAAPSLPDAYNQAVDGIAIAEGTGSCGTAAHRRASVVVQDIAGDPLWTGFRELALPLGLRACWSTPILGAGGELLGTWAVYSQAPGEPTAADETIIATATRLAAIAIENSRSRSQLERVKRNIELILHSAGEGIYGVDAEGVTTFINRAALTLLQLDEKDAVGRKLHDVIHHTRPDGRPYPALECPIYQAAHGGPTASVKQEVFWRTDGTSFPVDYVTSPLKDQGEVIGAVTVFTDITDRLRTENELRERADELARLAAQLQKSNKELDQFAYVTSHDLKAPLRGIANLSRWLEEDLGAKITPDSKEHLELLRGRVNRMEALIDAILEYSRVGRVKLRPEQVDVEAMLRETTDLLAPPPGFQVVVAPGMPSFTTERMRLQQVFMNLVGNAIKHHHDKPNGRVEVSAEDAGAFWRFRVADNGPGIAPRFHDKVFVIFQTLEARDKVEGTGIGLALVKKIVESYGGAIRLDSDAGRGATFEFTWPKRLPQRETP